MPETDSQFRPYLQIATFCEKVLQEADGVVSIIRMIDRITHFGREPELHAFQYQFMVIVVFKAGPFMKGKATIKLRPISPSGKQLTALEFPILFESEDRGAGFVAGVNFTFEEEGLYWFDVLLEEDVATRIPMRVLYHPSMTLPFPPQ
ncbi:MAG TPA: hypothetical protein VEG30_05990 [Terriglobales bacterium]|nr:hypothetical protein [Terriglobales bacterium]